jgi:hypothetical protein
MVRTELSVRLALNGGTDVNTATRVAHGNLGRNAVKAAPKALLANSEIGDDVQSVEEDMDWLEMAWFGTESQ